MGKGDPKGGRPRVEFDLKKLTELVKIQCTREECCAVLGVSESTVDRRLQELTGEGFEAFHKKHSDDGKTSLRRAQFKAAVDDHQPTMLVWMGKQMLGQTDKADLKHSGRVTLHYTPEDNDI